MTWQFDGVRQGLKLIERYQPAVIWSTYPIATAHVIGAKLQRRTGLPWVADFRDPMAQDGYPSDPKTWQHFMRIEQQAMQQACLTTFTTPGAARMYKARYPDARAQIEVLENGYDEETFAKAERELGERIPLNPGFLTLLHSGIVYPSERDPTALFAALEKLKQSSPKAAARLKVRFRAAVHEDLLHTLANKYGVSDAIEVLPAIPYQAALAEMLCADGLLVLQAANCNDQIPAKIYEYLRCRKPIIGLTDPMGDTAAALKSAGVSAIATLEDPDEILNIMQQFVSNSQFITIPTDDAVYMASREGRTECLVKLLRDFIK